MFHQTTRFYVSGIKHLCFGKQKGFSPFWLRLSSSLKASDASIPRHYKQDQNKNQFPCKI